MGSDLTEYPFKQGIDYGPRKGTLGLAFHMAEGGDGTVTWLAQRAGESRTEWIARVRGVSANAVIKTDGTVVQMVHWGNASGSMNPKDRAGTTGFYNINVLKSVLGQHFGDPNAYSISAEICGFRKDGPTDAQVNSAIAWGRDMASRFPTLRGAYGHADQTDTKGCPGLTTNMRRIFDALGGHGLWRIDMPGLTIADLEAAPGTVKVKNIQGVLAVQVDDPRSTFPMPPGTTKETVAKGRLVGDPLGADTPGNDRHTVRLIGDELAVILDQQVDYVTTGGGDILHRVELVVDGQTVAQEMV